MVGRTPARFVGKREISSPIQFASLDRLMVPKGAKIVRFSEERLPHLVDRCGGWKPTLLPKRHLHRVPALLKPLRAH